MSILYDRNKDNTVEKALSLAERSGILRLCKRTLKSFPPIAVKFNFLDLLTLDLSQNKLTEYPKQLCNCHFLSISNCSHNLLKSLPDEFDQLQNLLQLDLSYNCLTVLPKALCRLQKLQVLIICNNKLSSLPDDCGDLVSLVVLDASNNKIQSASARLVNLKALRIFKLRNNALQSVPEEWCHLRLHCLDLSVNQLTNLPPAYSEMRPGLTQLNLELNPMQSPPPHVCCRGPSHVLKFLASCRAGTELPWHYAKPSSSSGAAVSSVGRRNQNNLSAATSKEPADATVANSTGVLIAAPEDFADFNGDALPSMPQLTQRRISTVSSGSSSATQLSASAAALQFSSSNSVMQRLEQQSSRLGGSSTLPRRRTATIVTLDATAVDASVSASAPAAPSAPAHQSASPVAGDQLGPADASAVAAMRAIVERRLGVRLPDRSDRLAERLIDGQLLGQLAELAGQEGEALVSPGGHGRLLDLYQRLGVSEANLSLMAKLGDCRVRGPPQFQDKVLAIALLIFWLLTCGYLLNNSWTVAC
ncbi:hypothetical protein BOX15_Mlig005145g1 [Macrostomum lignano]|uniref:Calponin-homology (CH) domain-containing protein n=1 Tax=Macrostomum lignano TaxID=282301 RepID=A0A267GMR0_9PLAT|nr:hypothetical protein BOX15_Mlig005145g1 [Macrostomum lignano]